MDTKKGLNIDKVTMSSELWYLQDYDNTDTAHANTVPAKGASLPSNTIEVLVKTIPAGNIGLVEVQDVSDGRWYELQSALTLPLNTSSYQLLLTTLIRGNQIGVGIWRPATTSSGFPSYSLNIRVRTFLPPFTT